LNIGEYIDHPLPGWIFEVDEDDEYEGSSSLLQELEIDISHIYRYVGIIDRESV
jgi:hypothetical protein